MRAKPCPGSAACALPAEKRDAFIRAQCGADAELLAQVQKLLAQDSRHDLPLDAPVGRAIDQYRSTPDAPEAARAEAAGTLGAIYAGCARSAGSRRTYQREAPELARFANGEVHPDVGQALNNLANTLMQLRDYEASEAAFREALRIMRETSPPGDLNIASVLSGLGASLLSMRRGADAEPYLRESLEIRRRGSPNHFLTFWVQSRLGESLNQQRRYAEAEPLLVEALERLRNALRASDWMVRTTMHRLADVYEATDRAELAVPLRASAGPRE